MKNISDVAVIVQARLGSQRIPQKMIKPFSNTTLLDIMLEKIKQSNIIQPENFFVSVNEKELVDIAKDHNVNIFHRSENSAKSEGTPLSDMYEWWDKINFKYCILINACAPFLTIETIDEFIEVYLNTYSNGLFGVIKKQNYFWNKQKSLVTPWPKGQACMNTKIVEETYEAAHCLYAGRMDLIGQGIWMGKFEIPGDIKLFPMKEIECFDIDYPWQFDFCEKIYEKD